MSCRLCRHGPRKGGAVTEVRAVLRETPAKRAYRPPMLVRLGRVADVVQSNQNDDPDGGKGNLVSLKHQNGST